MADPVLVATPKATNANSYVTRDRAQAIIDERLNATVWTAASNADKDRALIMATRLLEEGMTWYGERRTIEQSLRWPRSNIYDPDGYGITNYDVIPALLERATAEFAVYLLARDRLAEPDALGNGVSTVKAGEVEATIDPSEVLPFIPDRIAGMLACFGELSGALSRGESDRQLPVIRT